MGNSEAEVSLRVTTVAENGATIVELSGRVDCLNAEALTRAFSTVPACRMVADCSGMSHTGSAGLRSLWTTVKNCRRDGGDLRLASMQPQVSRVLRISGFTGLIEVFDNVPTAVASFGAWPRQSQTH